MSIESKARKVALASLVWIITVLIVFGGIWFWISRSKAKLTDETGSASKYKEEVRIIADSFSGYAGLRKSSEELKSKGIKLIVQDDGADYIGRIKALRDNKADMAVFTVDSLLTSGIKIKEFPVSTVLIIDETKGADAIVAYKSALKNIQDLNRKDAKIVLTPSSPSEFLARVALASFNLPELPNNWIEEADGAKEVYNKFRKASRTEPKAYVMWEPYVSMALKDSDATIILGSDKLKGYIVDVLVARREFIKQRPDLVKQVIQAYLSTAYSYKDNMPKLVLEDSRKTDSTLSKSESEQVVKGIQWKNTLENYAHFNLLDRKEARGLEDLETIISKITGVLVTTGAISQEEGDNIEPTILFYDRFLQELKQANFHPGKKLNIISGNTLANDEQVRGDVELPVLTEGQWDSLIPVGQMRVQDISFRRGTSELSDFSKHDLQELTSKLKSFPQYYLVITGNARAEGDPKANLKLAETRSKVVAEYLILRLGISRNRIKTIAAEPSMTGGDAQSVSFQLGQIPY
ncbi:MAG: OmpA family protein [Sedimentisphaerales bacterium]|nr:OmpA family protein [Sedimentisphaerales bacterium]